MFVYWCLFVVLAAGALLNHQSDDGRRRLAFFILIALPTALMVGLRMKIGPDWPAYASIYKFSSMFTFGETLQFDDPGFRVLCWSLRQLSAPFWVLNAVCGTIFVAGLFLFCRRQPNPWLAFLVAFPYLVIVVAMSGDRQSVALGFLFLALNAFERGRLYLFVFLLVVGALFHGSVLMMLPVCLLSYSRNALQRTLLLLIVVALGVHFFSDTFSVYARRYSMDSIQSSGVIYRLAMNSAAALIYLFWPQRFGFDGPQAKLWRNVALFTLVLVPLMALVPSSTAIDRFLLYLFPLQFVVLSRIPTAFSTERRMTSFLALLVIAYAAAVQATFLNFGTFAKYYVPYRSIFDR